MSLAAITLHYNIGVLQKAEQIEQVRLTKPLNTLQTNY